MPAGRRLKLLTGSITKWCTRAREPSVLGWRVNRAGRVTTAVLPPTEMTKFTLAYELHDHGWATATLGNDDVTVEMTVSYLHDTLRELANAAYHLSRGTADRMVVFMDEPGEHQLKITRLNDGDCSYCVDWYDDWHSWGMKSVGDGYPKRVTQGIVSARRFTQQVHTVLWTLFDDFGIDGYKSRWGEHDFPEAEMRRLSGLSQH